MTTISTEFSQIAVDTASSLTWNCSVSKFPVGKSDCFPGRIIEEQSPDYKTGQSYCWNVRTLY